MIEGYEDCRPVVEQVAKSLGARYKKHQIDYDDMVQECWIWVMTHTDKISEWRQTDHFVQMLAKSLQNECIGVGEAARADQSGMSKDDRLRDARDAARESLDESFALDIIAAVEAGAGKTCRPWRGGPYKPEVLRCAFLDLSVEDREIIQGRHGDGETNRSMARRMGLTDQTMSYQYTRALNRLVSAAGGIDDPLVLADEAGPQFLGWAGRWSTSSRVGLDLAIDDYAAGYDS